MKAHLVKYRAAQIWLHPPSADEASTEDQSNMVASCTTSILSQLVRNMLAAGI